MLTLYEDLAKVSLITDMFLAVCYKEFGNEAFEKFKAEATSAKPADSGLQQMFAQMSTAPAAADKPKPKLADPWYALENDKGKPTYKLVKDKWVAA